MRFVNPGKCFPFLAAVLGAALLCGCASIKESSMYPTMNIDGTFKAYFFGAGEKDPQDVVVLGREDSPYKVFMEGHGKPYRLVVGLNGVDAVSRAEDFIGTTKIEMNVLSDKKGKVIGYIILPGDFTQLTPKDQPTITYRLQDNGEVHVSVTAEFFSEGVDVFK